MFEAAPPPSGDYCGDAFRPRTLGPIAPSLDLCTMRFFGAVLVVLLLASTAAARPTPPPAKECTEFGCSLQRLMGFGRDPCCLLPGPFAPAPSLPDECASSADPVEARTCCFVKELMRGADATCPPPRPDPKSP